MTTRSETKLKLGMPHLLMDGSLNMNQMAKIFGDLHWRYMSEEPSKENINGKRVYQSFLRSTFDMLDPPREDQEITIISRGKYIDDYIFKTEHLFGDNCAELYSIGIHVDGNRIIRSEVSGSRDREFWNSHRESKLAKYNSNATRYVYPTYPSIDFNAAGILYCANYLKFVYQYADEVKKDVTIKQIDFFGNIEPYDTIEIIPEGNNIFIESNQKIIAKCICYLEDKNGNI